MASSCFLDKSITRINVILVLQTHIYCAAYYCYHTCSLEQCSLPPGRHLAPQQPMKQRWMIAVMFLCAVIVTSVFVRAYILSIR